MEQTDLILLVVTGISVLFGLNRGFTSEILSLAVYVFSGVLGYSSAPVFQPVFAAIPHEPTQKALAVLLGTFVAWLVLKILMSSLVHGIKSSRLAKLDRSLGGLFGLARAAVIIVAVNIVFAFLMPHIIQSSKILTLTQTGISKYFDFPEFENPEEESDEDVKEEQAGKNGEKDRPDWKKRLLRYLENQTLNTKDGEKKLISSVAGIFAKNVSENMMQSLPEEQRGIISPEKMEKIVSKTVKKTVIE